MEVITFTLQYPSFLFPGKTQYSTENAPADLQISQQVNSCNPLNWIKVGRRIQKMQPDLLITCYWMAFFAPCYSIIERLAKRNGKTRCMALVHNMIPHEPSILDKLFAPFFVRSTDGFVALSESVVKDIDRLDKNAKPKTSYPHPIYDHYGEKMSKEDACQALNLNPENQYMLFFGLVRAYKGLDLLLQAFADKRLRGKKVKLIVAGEFYSNAEKYAQLESELHLSEHIVWYKEFVPADKVRYYFAAADLVAQPYKTATQSGITQIAYHFERPMLVTNVGGLAEIVPHGKVGYVVAPDVAEIADALVDFVDNHTDADYCEGILEEKAKYAWSNMTAQLFAVADKA